MTHLGYFFRRAVRNFRGELGTNLATILTLTVAFATVTVLATVAVSLGRQVSRWGGAESFQVTAYLQPDAEPGSVAQLQGILGSMPEVRDVRVVPGEEARARLVEAFPEDRDAWAALDAGFFPGYVEIGLDTAAADEATYRDLVARIGGLSIVEEVETHDDWYAQALGVHEAARTLAVALGILVVFATIFVVSHTIRLNLHRRRRQLEVMSMCGATPGFIRAPFLFEGAFGSLVAGLLALGTTALFVETVRGRLVEVAPVLGNSPIEHLPSVAWAAFLAAAAAVGITGAWLSTRAARST